MSTGEAKKKIRPDGSRYGIRRLPRPKRAYPYEQINFALGTLQGTPYNTQNYGI